MFKIIPMIRNPTLRVRQTGATLRLDARIIIKPRGRIAFFFHQRCAQLTGDKILFNNSPAFGFTLLNLSCAYCLGDHGLLQVLNTSSFCNWFLSSCIHFFEPTPCTRPVLNSFPSSSSATLVTIHLLLFDLLGVTKYRIIFIMIYNLAIREMFVKGVKYIFL